jgi:hypothetical protein
MIRDSIRAIKARGCLRQLTGQLTGRSRFAFTPNSIPKAKSDTCGYYWHGHMGGDYSSTCISSETGRLHT